MSSSATIRVVLPYHLRSLAGVDGELSLEITGAAGSVTLGAVLDTLEARFPNLRGTIRDHDTLTRRPFIRYYACKEDLSHESCETPLPESVVAGVEPLMIVGAMAGG
jgi:sulfur-carrier protein